MEPTGRPLDLKFGPEVENIINFAQKPGFLPYITGWPSRPFTPKIAVYAEYLYAGHAVHAEIQDS